LPSASRTRPAEHLLAERRRFAADREVVVALADESRWHERARNIERTRRKLQQRLPRRTLVRAAIVVVEVGRVEWFDAVRSFMFVSCGSFADHSLIDLSP